MTDTKIQIKAKAISTQVTTEMAARLFNNKGTRVMIIAELVSDTTHEDQAGNRGVDCLLENLELVVADGKTGEVADEHIRTIQQALYRTRVIANGGQDELPLGEEDGPAPKVTDVLAQGKGLVTTDDEGNPTGLFSHEDSAVPAPV